MVGCGGGTPATYTVKGTVSGLVGSGLTLGICKHFGRGCSPFSTVGVHANGAFTLYSGSPLSDGAYGVVVAQPPSSPAQRCAITNTTVNIKDLPDTGVTVSCLGKFAYVTDAADNTLSSYIVDATSGALTAIGPPVSTGASPHATVGYQFAFDGDGVPIGQVFVANEGSGNISVFEVNTTTGALTTRPGSPIAAGADPQGLTLAGGTLYIANAGSDNVSAYWVDTLTAAPGFPVAVGKGPTSIVLGPNAFAYVANHGGSNDISAFKAGLTPVPGSPVAGSPFPDGGKPLSLAVGAGAKFLYAANPDATNPSISDFSIDPSSGALTRLSGSPFPLSVSHYMATDQTGAFPCGTSGAGIVGYAIDAATGALTALPGFPVAAGADAYSISIDPSNQFLYAADDGAANVAAFRIDATGSLTPIAGSPFAAGNHPESIATF